MHNGRAFSATLTAIVAAGMLLAAPTAASALSDNENSFLQKVNGERTQRGLGTLRTKSDLILIAQQHSAEMAKQDDLRHTHRLDLKVKGCWTLVGENVGVGPDVDSLHQALMDSPSHRDNVLGAYNQIGIGVATAEDGSLYVTEVFASRSCTTHPAPRKARVRAPAHRTPPSAVRPHARPAAPRARRASAAQSVDLLVRMLDLDSDGRPEPGPVSAA